MHSTFHWCIIQTRAEICCFCLESRSFWYRKSCKFFFFGKKSIKSGWKVNFIFLTEIDGIFPDSTTVSNFLYNLQFTRKFQSTISRHLTKIYYFAQKPKFQSTNLQDLGLSTRPGFNTAVVITRCFQFSDCLVVRGSSSLDV